MNAAEKLELFALVVRQLARLEWSDSVRPVEDYVIFKITVEELSGDDLPDWWAAVWEAA